MVAAPETQQQIKEQDTTAAVHANNQSSNVGVKSVKAQTTGGEVVATQSTENGGK
jgi:hypothetical protein